MPQLQIWTDKREDARSNVYAARCPACNNTVTANTGTLISTVADSGDGGPLLTKALHNDCEPPPGWYWRAGINKGGTTIDIVKQRLRNFGDGTTPEPTPEPAREPTEAELAKAAQEIIDATVSKFVALVPDLVRKTMHEATRTVEIKLPKPRKSATVKDAHKLLPIITMAVAAKTNPFIVGPAGSGKTTLCMQVADALGMKFYMSNSVAGKHELLGFRDAHGKPVHTDFYKAYKTGGLFLFDEADNSNPNAMVALNSAIANGVCEFAGELVRAHKDFQVIASANTFGRGADQMYVGRNKLDAATLDRYQTYIMDYDEEAELAWAGNDEWTRHVQKVRSVIFAEKIAHVVSPRASIAGALLLAVGMERELVEESCIWKGLDNNHRARINARMGV